MKNLPEVNVSFKDLYRMLIGPTIIKVAETFVKEYEMEDRMEVLTGDYTCDPIGEGYDLIWASNALNFAKDNMDSLMKMSRKDK